MTARTLINAADVRFRRRDIDQEVQSNVLNRRIYYYGSNESKWLEYLAL